MKLSYLKTISYFITATTLLLCSSQNYAQQYYKWVDAKGSTHYTTTPPPKGAKRLDKVSTYGNSHQTANPTTQQGQPATPVAAPNTPQQAPQAIPATPPANTVKPQSPTTPTVSSER
ncbi:DUF4124 domain-containing protein [Acinetobacter sp. C26M]|uniref:DUF4124 domain-containing protein n=1 Tax=unclassified Acinetobacter TaxID=196816 RepID=UPI002036AB41|nr:MULTISPECIES: DUF4124 domain-containing protein [unclassified Acinetobacter]USA47076.1 DUF4124 domain-containing protein [Acinetobacter sp. C26M]USA50557.1 DUF4124 domain-containing protein [Acinetobacter sp. C26G]